MKKVIVIIVLLLSLFTSIFASKVSFSVPETITKYSINGEEKEVIDNSITLDINDNDIITIICDDNKKISSKIVFTEHDKIDATFRWDISNTKQRFILNNSKPKSIKSGVNEITLKNLPSNELSIFTLEAKVNNKWSECGIVGLIPVNVIEDEQEIIHEEVLTPVIDENSSIDTLEPKLISNAKVNRKVILSSYFISSLQILSFDSSTVNNGLGVKASVALPITNNLSFVTDVNYQWIKYTNRDFTELALMGKLRLNSNINDSGIVFIQLGGGENFVTKESNKAYYPLVSTGLGLELYFTKSIALSFLGEYSVSFQRDSVNNHLSGAVGLSIAFGKEAKVWRSLF